MKLKIKDGRGELYQWDTGRKLIIEDGANIDYLHFADFSKDDGVSYQSEVIEENGIRCCRIPNACFANESTKLVVYAVEADDDGMATTTTVVFPIRKRQKPSDYTASPEIIISAEEILRKASAKADEAESYMNTSMQYAINPVDEVISGTDKYSSLHWASKANDIYNDVVEYVGSPSDPSSALGSIDTAKQSAITDIDAHVDTVKIDLTSYVENAESYASQALSYSTSASTSESNAKAAAEAAAAAESNSLSYKDLAETAKSNAQNARDEAVSAKNIAIETIVAIQGIESNVSSMKSSVDASEANVTTMQSDVSTMKASVETLKSETQTIVDNAENDVKGLLSTKADKTELAVERARIDSLSRLSEGSTTGDAELIDLRIGADGVTYGNAGTAVRTQISDLKGDLVNIKDLTIVIGNRQTPDETVSSMGLFGDGTASANGNASLYKYSVIPNSLVYIKTTDFVVSSSTKRGSYQFQSASESTKENLVGECKKDAFEGFITVPNNAHYLVIARPLGNNTVGKYDVKEKHDDDITRLDLSVSTNTEEIAVIKEWIDLSKLDLDVIYGTPAGTSYMDSQSRLITKDIKKADFNINVSFDDGYQALYVIYDKLENPTSATNSGWKTEAFTIPSGSYYRIAFAQANNYNISNIESHMLHYFVKYDAILKDVVISKQDKLIAGNGIKIGDDGKTIYTEESYANKSNILYGKTLVCCGDSITYGVQLTDADRADDGQLKTYGWQIADRNNMTFYNKGVSGSTMIADTNRDGFSIENGRYTQLPDDIDYLTIWFGWNDVTYEQNLGTIDDTTNTSFYGAYNVVMEYLLNKYPYTKICLVVPYTMSDGVAYRQAVRDIANKWGVACFDMFQKGTPLFYVKENDVGVLQSVISSNREKYMASGNIHPNIYGHNQLADMLEHFLRGI